MLRAEEDRRPVLSFLSKSRLCPRHNGCRFPRGTRTMPSRERLARINLHQVSFGVDKFSAELDLVNSCSSKERPITIPRRKSRLETIGQTNLIRLANLDGFPRSSSLASPGLCCAFTTGPSAPHPAQIKRETRVGRRSLTCVNVWCSDFNVQFRSSLVLVINDQGTRHHSMIFERALVARGRPGAGRTG
jgi:hypothetical protein